MRSGPVAVVLVAVLSGCVGEAPESEDPAEPPAHYAAVTRTGELDLDNPAVGRPETGPACQVLFVTKATRISNLTFMVQWTPADDSSRTLRAWIVGPGGTVSNETEGPSPLKVTTEAFDAADGQEVRMLVGRAASSQVPVLVGSSQTLAVHITFVWTVNPGDVPEDRGRWDDRRHCDA